MEYVICRWSDSIADKTHRNIFNRTQKPLNYYCNNFTNLVFGNFRSPNILITPDGRNEIGRFDWCDEEDRGKYPVDINDISLQYPCKLFDEVLDNDGVRVVGPGVLLGMMDGRLGHI